MNREVRVLGVVALFGVLAGCQFGEALRPGPSPTSEGAGWPAGLRDDVTALYQYPQTDPWLRGDDGRVRGVKVLLYAVCAATDKGEFVGGPIEAQLRVFRWLPDGTKSPEVVHQWRYDWRQAQGYRLRERAVMGDRYGLLLAWPEEMVLDGEEIQLVYSYERRDGQKVLRSGSRMRVPPRHEEAVPSQMRVAPPRPREARAPETPAGVAQPAPAPQGPGGADDGRRDGGVAPR
jgi:hypothetical protein